MRGTDLCVPQNLDEQKKTRKEQTEQKRNNKKQTNKQKHPTSAKYKFQILNLACT